MIGKRYAAVHCVNQYRTGKFFHDLVNQCQTGKFFRDLVNQNQVGFENTCVCLYLKSSEAATWVGTPTETYIYVCIGAHHPIARHSAIKHYPPTIILYFILPTPIKTMAGLPIPSLPIRTRIFKRAITQPMTPCAPT